MYQKLQKIRFSEHSLLCLLPPLEETPPLRSMENYWLDLLNAGLALAAEVPGVQSTCDCCHSAPRFAFSSPPPSLAHFFSLRSPHPALTGRLLARIYQGCQGPYALDYHLPLPASCAVPSAAGWAPGELYPTRTAGGGCCCLCHITSGGKAGAPAAHKYR